MTTRLTIDADITEDDLRRDLIEMEIPGLGVYEFPGVINALAVVRVARMAAQGRGGEELSPAEVVALLGDLVPDDVLADWSRKGFEMFDPANLQVLERIISALLAEYSRRDELIAAAGPPGKSPTAPTTPPPFSGTGRSSSPTAAESTASPFPVT